MSLNQTEQEAFRAAVELARTGYQKVPCHAELLEMSPVEKTEEIVLTHESYADFAKTHGQGKTEMYHGLQLHYWRGVQFGKGTPRGTLYLMEFERAGVNASFFL